MSTSWLITFNIAFLFFFIFSYIPMDYRFVTPNFDFFGIQFISSFFYIDRFYFSFQLSTAIAAIRLILSGNNVLSMANDLSSNQWISLINFSSSLARCWLVINILCMKDRLLNQYISLKKL